jgi:lipopolysaccharide/colanic/teichoic acid biosynthesis glycosyltransferase
MFGTAVELNHVADLPVMEYNTWDVSRSTLLLKRVLDVVVASVALVVLSPLLLLIAVLILLDGGMPVLFTQVRVSQHGKPFTMLKFRTMVANAEQLLPDLVPFDKLQEPMFKLSVDPRVTLVGRALRRASLDELPQLLNVLKGDMSLVGPRPCIPYEIENFAPHHFERFLVPAGVTGLWQVSARASATFGEALDMDVAYARSWSFGLDLRLLGRTPAQVFRQRKATS